LSVHILLDANPDPLASDGKQNVPQGCTSNYSSSSNGTGVDLSTDFPSEGTVFRFIISLRKKWAYGNTRLAGYGCVIGGYVWIQFNI